MTSEPVICRCTNASSRGITSKRVKEVENGEILAMGEAWLYKEARPSARTNVFTGREGLSAAAFHQNQREEEVERPYKGKHHRHGQAVEWTGQTVPSISKKSMGFGSRVSRHGIFLSV